MSSSQFARIFLILGFVQTPRLPSNHPDCPLTLYSDPSSATFDSGLYFLTNAMARTIVIFMEVDNNQCENQCFSTCWEAAAYSKEL